jgi:hypothetical protein
MWMLLRTFVSGLEYSSLVRKILMATREEHFAFFFQLDNQLIVGFSGVFFQFAPKWKYIAFTV